MSDASNQERLTSSWIPSLSRLVTLFERVWLCVRGTLCNDAPEGYVPADSEQDMETDTKSLSSYAWRGLKESRLESSVNN